MKDSYYSIIGWFLIIVGWLYNNHQSNVRESRKELRASLNNIEQEIHEIQLKALEYYITKVSDSDKLAFEIKAGQDRLVTKIERLEKLHKGYFKTDSLVDFLDVITGGDFEEKNREIRSYSSESDNLLIEISHSADDLINCLEDDFCKIFNKSSRAKDGKPIRTIFGWINGLKLPLVVP